MTPKGGNADAEKAMEACIIAFRQRLHLPDPGALRIALATIAANRRPGDPIWTVLVAPPGYGKTEILGAAGGQSDCHPAATLTEASLLSGTPKKERSKDARGGLLRVMGDFGILVMKDFGSVLNMNRDSRAASLAALREVYDGSWTRHLGVEGGVTLHWEGKVGLLAGVTPALDSHHSVMSLMGERFALYRLPPIDPAEQARRALLRDGDPKGRRGMADAFGAVLDAVNPNCALPTGPDDTSRLIALAELAVRCRSAIERDSHSREISLIPDPEGPARLALVLRGLLEGLVLTGTPEAMAWQIVSKVALDCMPALRRSVLGLLMDRPEGAEAKEVGASLGYPTGTARRGLEDLAAHGVLSRRGSSGNKGDIWVVSPWTRTRWWATSCAPEMSEGVREGAMVRASDEEEGASSPEPQRVQTDISGTQETAPVVLEGRGP